MPQAALVADAVHRDIELTGYYPAVVEDCLATALGNEQLRAYAVHHEPTFDQDQLRRHITVLALTETRLIIAHVDEHGAPDGSGEASTASASSEAVRLERVDSVVVTRVIADPENYQPGSSPAEVVLTIGWGAVSRIDLEPATCGDPQCEADHGFTGSSTNDDLGLRVSSAADGGTVVDQMLAFARALSNASGERLR